MIYILSGNDSLKKTSYIKSLIKGRERIDLRAGDKAREVLLEHASSTSLFGDSPSIFVENILGEGNIAFNAKDLALLNESPTIFVFLEDKLLKKDEAKYKNYATIESFEEKSTKKASEFNTFAIADMYGSRDKIGTWVMYREAIEKGVEPEAISGIIFWKIKTMILNNSKTFSSIELKNQSSNIVSLYHRAHRGECDFVIGLEQFILSSLSR
jgi:hypothetical protein